MTEGDAGELSRETILYDEPSRQSEALGKLPSGTVFTFLGEKENGFARVRVELEDNEEIEGWISDRFLKAPEKEKPKKQTEKDPKEPKRPLKRGAVPKDEAALLRRESTFQYGIFVGPNFNLLSHQFGEESYNGVGFMGGGFVGFYVSNEVTVRGEAGYSLVNGSSTDGVLSFGLLDIGLTGEYAIDRFLIFGSIRHNFGIGVGDIPRTVRIDTAADVSSLWADFGGGVRFPINGVLSAVVRGKYAFSFNRVPVALQYFALLAYLEIQG